MTRPLVYADVCAGISASTVAWKPLGWRPAYYAEINPFASRVLAHHYPEVPNYGDFTTVTEADTAGIDLLMGGTPCQDFSVAGLRAGLAGERGNLTLEFLRLVERARPRWVCWENVPGVLSADGGRALGAFLGGLGQLGYGFAWRVLDAQYFGLAQRRKRVFVAGCAGGAWQRAAAVLLERASLRGDSAPRRGEGPGAPDGAAVGTRDGVARALTTSCQRLDADTETLIPFDTTQITSAINRSRPEPNDPRHALAKGAHPPAVAVSLRGRDGGATAELGGEVSPTLHTASGGGGSMPHVMAFHQTQDPISGEVSPALSRTSMGMGMGSLVRRLTPRECERLMGFPDDYTAIPGAKDGPRYAALGNSIAVPVLAWIGRRIAAVDALAAADEEAA
jgi:DNA (cytosine-5)-methyltransferase 1